MGRGHKMRILILLLSYVSITLSIDAVYDKQFPTGRNGDHLTNLLVKDNIIYVAENGMVHMLDMGLSSTGNFSTCDGDNCDNINKVLTQSGDLIVLCGTGNNGVCQAWNGSSFVYNSSNVLAGEGNYLVVSSDKNRPAVGLTHDGKLYLGVTYGPQISEDQIRSVVTYRYLLSVTNIIDSFSPIGYVYLKHELYENYKIYFRYIFKHENFIYFLTNQKLDTGTTSELKSKLIRICINETYGNEKQIKFYTDLVLSCESGGDSYSLVQDAVFLPAKGFLVAGFTKGNDPEAPEQDSAVCVYTMDTITDGIGKAKKDFITCNNSSTGYIAESEYYLKSDPHPCLSEENYDVLKGDYVCPTGSKGVKVMSNNMIMPNSSHKLDANVGHITKLEGVDRYGLYPDLVYGTSKGYFGKLTVLNDDLSLYEYETVKKIDNHPVTGIHITTDSEDTDRLYIQTSRKIFRLNNTRCNEFKNYKSTQDGKNPSCGWCIKQDGSSATKRPSCTGTWNSSLSDKITMDISPKFIQAISTGITEFTVTAANLPPVLTDHLRCKFDAEGTQIGALVQAIPSSGSFSCQFPNRNEHRKITVFLEAWGFLYGQADVQIYNCSGYKSCETCRESTDIQCVWCPSTLTCQASGSGCISGSKASCPKLLFEPEIYVPAGIPTTITLLGQKLVSVGSQKCVVTLLNGTTVEFTATVTNISVTCTVNVDYEDNMNSPKESMEIAVIQGSTAVAINQDTQNRVTVYKCEVLGTDCTLCNALNSSRYNCHWCQGEQGRCGHTTVCTASGTCPEPEITQVSPSSGGYRGGTELTITVADMGDRAVNDVIVGDLGCGSPEITTKYDPDYGSVNTGFVCVLGRDNNITRVGTRNITVNFKESGPAFGSYTFKDPNVTSIYPSYGSLLGGTRITLSGNNLGIGNRLQVRLKSISGPISTCNEPKFVLQNITCTTGEWLVTTVRHIQLNIDGENYESFGLYFEIRAEPEVKKMEGSRGKTILSGGTDADFTGVNLNSTAKKKILVTYGGMTEKNDCKAITTELLKCKVPEAPDSLKTDLMDNLGLRRKRSIPDGSIEVQIIIQLDNYEAEFTMSYFRDPEFKDFEDADSVRLFKSDEQELTIQGQYVNLVGTEESYKVYIGPSTECRVIRVSATNLTCVPPVAQVPLEDTPPVTVVLGNFNQSIGYVKIVKIEVSVSNILMIVLPVAAGVVLVGLVVFVVFWFKYRRVKGKAVKFEKNLADMELQIKKVFREEFLDMHTTMSRVNESLIEKGFPYNNYQRYCFLMMFPGEWNMEEHPLMHEPVVSKKKVADHVRGKLKQGMSQFEDLLKNKFFLVSIVSTMEKQKKFFLKEKSNMAGHLSVALLGKMEYVHEILTVLLAKLVDETPQKSQKTLFRRCESITEKLLSNWLVLSLYPHVKLHSGSPLYMLLKGTQLTMESGPIDAITGDSKYTLSEDKLLRQDDKPNTLTLKIMVDNNDEVRDCKVLDCDTISQVKAKCLSQIYVNFPASQLTVDSSDLNLEWHWGTGGRLIIQDEDTTSKRDGEWLRLNTLEHYTVTDGSSMALVDPHGAIDQEDYVNLATIRIETDGCNGSVHSNEPLTPPDEESGLITRWHLVKPDSDQQKSESVVVEELYLNRLITTKQSVLEYMKNLFDTILSSTVPPPTKFLFDYLDELGEKNKVDSDTLHAWKSQCYTIRFWATLINKPYNLFDQRIPSYVETSMEVISQVLIESCSLKAPEYTKDSSPGKLIFKKDMMDYRDKVKQYYTQVKTVNQEPEDLRLYLKDLNKFQSQQLSFNRQAALYSLYAQLQPYMDDIMEDLENNEETKSLHLDRKLANFNSFMQED